MNEKSESARRVFVLMPANSIVVLLPSRSSIVVERSGNGSEVPPKAGMAANGAGVAKGVRGAGGRTLGFVGGGPFTRGVAPVT